MSADTDATSDDTCNVPCIITCGLNKYFTKDNAPVAAPAGPVVINNPSPTKKPAGYRGMSPSAKVPVSVVDNLFRLKSTPKHIEFNDTMFDLDIPMEKTAADQIVKASISNPEVLLSHLIDITQKSDDIPAGRYLVTGIRQYVGKATEYCLIAKSVKEIKSKSPLVTPTKDGAAAAAEVIQTKLEFSEAWVSLKRDQNKQGVEFKILKKC